MLGQILQETGMILNNEMLQLVHLQLAEGERVKPHDHKGQEVFFTIIRGEVELSLDGAETHRLTPGQVLHFAGEAEVGVHALADSEFFVYLINRK